MGAKPRKHIRRACQACHCEIHQINGEEPDQSQKHIGRIDNISKGGFRFLTSRRFELEDRIEAVIFFSDGISQKTLGRICYCNEDEDSGGFAYGFSIINGFIR